MARVQLWSPPSHAESSTKALLHYFDSVLHLLVIIIVVIIDIELFSAVNIIRIISMGPREHSVK